MKSSWFLVAIGICLFETTSPLSFAGKDDGLRSIDLAISISKNVLHGQEAAEMQIRFFNKGKTDTYVGAEIAGFQNAPSKVFFEVRDSANHLTSCGLINITLSQRVIDGWWTRIAPLHYYGTNFNIDSQTCDAFKLPGEYRIVAVYLSEGGGSVQNAGNNGESVNAPKGKIESNELRIRFEEK